MTILIIFGILDALFEGLSDRDDDAVQRAVDYRNNGQPCLRPDRADDPEVVEERIRQVERDPRHSHLSSPNPDRW